MKPALVVVDMQTAFFKNHGLRERLEKALDYINYVIDLFNTRALPVVYIQDEEAGDGPGSEGFAFWRELNRKENAVCISKTSSNAFHETELTKILEGIQPDLVVICGFAAEHCVIRTYYGAIERGFSAVLLQNGFAGWKEEYSAFVGDLCPLISAEALEAILSDKSK